ncbi:PREDICTED: exocyst complex component EXO70B1-like [Camelina sativa]|uniref:Exocyst subunit Exo70 family protein n=1 Tax=Camelina sativa TaxID=90675 RepID=A0ABM0VL52_CAMSA|nr:PREDICTED: exocyst complex component EXO70B1-like [Camelina sativa]
MAQAGDENLYAAARDIARALGKDPSAAGDILQILSGYGASGNRGGDPRPTHSRGGANLHNLDRSLNSLERQISGYIVEDRPIWSDPVDSRTFLDSVDELIAIAGDLRSMAGDKSVAVCLSRADDLIQQVMFRLQEEFGYVVDRAPDSFDSDDDDFSGEEEDNVTSYGVIIARPVTDYKIVIEALQSSVIGDLNAIAVRMVAGGFGKECSRVYSSRRREFLEESLSRLHLRGLSMEQVQETPWQDLEDEIDRWIKAVTLVFRVFFPSERLLCDRVFSDLSVSSVTDLSFMEVCRGTTTQLLNFADAIALGSRLPERLFKVMDLYETMQDLIPKMETLFSDRYCLPLRHEAVAIHKRLGEAIRGIFMELENLIRRDPPKTAFPGGGIHPITRYVMNYLRAACKSRQSLEQILEQTGNEAGPDASALSVQLRWVLELLESNLEGKKRTYRDPSLCFLFMMNNGKYILDKVTDNELGSILGEDWIVKQTAKLRQYHSNYRRSSWNQVVGFLRTEAPYPKLVENLRLFKAQFDEVCKIQSQWVVTDGQLREELRSSVNGIVSPAYSSFIRKLKESPEINGRRGEPFIAYTVEDLEMMIKRLFKESSS